MCVCVACMHVRLLACLHVGVTVSMCVCELVCVCEGERTEEQIPPQNNNKATHYVYLFSTSDIILGCMRLSFV